MKKVFQPSLSLLLSLVIFGIGFGAQVSAQTAPVEQCTLVADVIAEGITIQKGVIVQSGTKTLVDEADDAGSATIIENPDTIIIKNWGLICIINVINNIVNWIFIILVVVAVALFAIAGFLWITSGASPTQQKKAGGMIMAGIMGLVLALLARIIPGIVTGIII